MQKRYRATIYVDIWADNPQDASDELLGILKETPNSFSDGFTELKHGSAESLIDEKIAISLIDEKS